jgi:hypothetical protein
MARRGAAGRGKGSNGAIFKLKENDMSKLFFSGLPTDPDVRALMASFPAIRPGDVIKHADIEEVLRVKRDSNRYRSITVAWRRKLRVEQSTILAAVPGVGFRSLSDAEKVDAAIDKFTSGARTQSRGILMLGSVNRGALDQVSERKAEHLNRLGRLAIGTSADAVKQIAALAPAKANPKPFEV